MIAFLTIPLALAIPSLEGVLLLRILEGRVPVLYRFERWCAGLFLGLAGSAYVLFFAVLAGVPVTLSGFLSVHAVMLAVLFFFFQFSIPASPVLPLPSFRALKQSLPPWLFFLGCFLALWTLLKVGVGAYDLLSVPPYFDDTYANWNMRAKAFYVSESLLLDLSRDHEMFFGGRVPSYPLTVYFAKVWLAQVHGGLQETLGTEEGPALHRSGASGAGWSEGVVNSVHLVWFIGLLSLLFCALIRTVSCTWALFGVYTLVSLPLVILHGTNPYSDVAMAAYLFFALSSLIEWAKTSDPLSQRSWFRIMCCSVALMIFVKSEALLLFLPPITVLFLMSWWRREHTEPGSWKTVAQYACSVACVALPWIAFKASLGLEFGNAQSVGGLSMALSLHEEVPGAIFNDLFYTGSYLLFFPVLLLLLTLTQRFWKRDAITLLLLFLAIVFLGQFLIYTLTPLGPEAANHTGFGRGMVQLLPSLVFLVTCLLAKLLSNDTEV